MAYNQQPPYNSQISTSGGANKPPYVSQTSTSGGANKVKPDGTPTYYQGSGSSSSTQPNSPGANGGAGVGGPVDQMDLTNQTIPFNKQMCFVKGIFTCGDEELYALESDKSLKGYDGRCPKCRKTHVVFDKPSNGFYASVKSIHDKIYGDKLNDQRSKGPKDINQLQVVDGKLPPLDHPILGKDKGIEGDSNSCYMDSTIFCMFAYSNVFDSLLHTKVSKKQPVKDLQKLLKENIVNVLRSESGFVERDALFHLRVQLSEVTGDPSFKEMEKDPSEFLRALETLFHYAPLRTVPPDQPPKQDETNVTTNIMWEMFDANPQNRLSTNIASIFRNSLFEIPAKLAAIPPFLILVAPRHTRTQRSYRYIIPDRQITLDNDVVQLVCLMCGKTNHDLENKGDFYSCQECFLKKPSLLTSPSTNASIACYCSGCSRKTHGELSEAERCEHNVTHMKTVTYRLNLFAVLCIESTHYVAFVKCHQRNQQHEWIFFDSMSDRLHNEKNVPCVSPAPNFDRWIDDAESDKYFFEDLDKRRSQGRPTSHVFNEDQTRQLRLFRDGAFFFYENSAANYQ